MNEFGDYVIYADESGDHSLSHIDPSYPIFVLCLCVFRKRAYVQSIVPKVQNLKFKWFGYDGIILHEREIRKRIKPFEILNNIAASEAFMEELGEILHSSKMKIVAAAIDKRRLKGEYLFQDNPYHIALSFCIEGVVEFLINKKQIEKITHFIFEKRGDKEDKELELEFRRICDGFNSRKLKLVGFEIKFIDKKANSAGMQLADLTARPIGLRVIRPEQKNRAFEIIAEKLVSHRRDIQPIRGLKVFP